MVEAESRHCDSETSLHVQRKRRSLPNGRDGSRNISACAEKTVGHLLEVHLKEETSLHVQRKHPFHPSLTLSRRNISACAEKTKSSFISNENVKKHLCMCRENSRVFAVQNEDQETSLHVQRKRGTAPAIPISGGNISACAEKTHRRIRYKRAPRKHLCMCRENE